MGIFGLSFALNGINKNSGEVLDNLTWTNISSLTDKIDVSSGDIKLNGKLYVTGNLCDNSGNCLGQCKNVDKHWDKITSNCVNNIQECTADIDNASLATKTWNNVNKVYGSCILSSCVDGYAKDGNTCKQLPGKSSSNPGTSCQNLYSLGARENGNYWITTSGNTYEVYCDMEHDGGGWTLIMNSKVRYSTKPGVDFDSSFASMHGAYDGTNDFYLSKYTRAGNIGISKFRFENVGVRSTISSLTSETNTLNKIFYRGGTNYSGWVAPTSYSDKYLEQTKNSTMPGRTNSISNTTGFTVYGTGNTYYKTPTANGLTRSYTRILFGSCHRYGCSLGYQRAGMTRNWWAGYTSCPAGSPGYVPNGRCPGKERGLAMGRFSPGTTQTDSNIMYRIRVK